MSVTDPGSAAAGIGLALAGIFAMFDCECKKDQPPDTSAQDAEIDAALAASEQAAKDAAEQLTREQELREGMAMGVMNAQEQILNGQAQKIQDEMADYNQQWKDAQKGMDPNDPGYEKFKQKYDDYQDYLKNKLENVNNQINEIKTTRAEEELARTAKGDWVRQQQQDLIQVKEQKSFLEAVSKGYGSEKGYNIDEVKARLNQLNERESELNNTLKANNAEITYQAAERDPIGPTPESKKLQEDYQDRKDKLEKEAALATKEKKEALKKEQEWLEKDMTNKANQAAIWNVMTKGAEVTSWAADQGVNILAKVTGPAGQSIKGAYDLLKPMAEATGEAISKIDKDSIKDPYTLGEEIAKDILKGSVDSVTGFVGDKIGDAKDVLGEPGAKLAGHIFTIGSETFKGGLEAGLDGEDIVDGAISGGLSGGLEAASGEILDGLIPEGELPDKDWSNMGVKDFTKNALGQGKGMMHGFAKDSIKEGVKDTVRDGAGDFISDAGEDAVKTASEFYSPMVKQAAQDATSKMKTLANSLGRTVSNPGMVYKS